MKICSSRIIGGLIFCLLSVSCVKGQKQTAGAGYGGTEQTAVASSATFLPNTVELVQAAPTQFNSWDMPTVRTYTFRVRLIQRLDSAPLRNQPMFIWDSVKKKGQPASTDTNGYMQWNEEVPYNYLADSKYIQLNRQIKGATQINRGATQIQLCVNPWIDRGDDAANKRSEFLDCTPPHGAKIPLGYEVETKDPNRALMGSDAEGVMSVDAPVYIRDVTVESDSSSISKGFAEYNYVLRFKPQFITHGADKLWLPVPLRKGKFRVTTMLREVVREEATGKIISEVVLQPNSDQGLEKNFFDYEFQQRVSFRPKEVGQMCELQLGLRVEPVNGPPGLRPFDGIFQLGDCTAYSFGFRPRPLTTEVRETLEKAYALNKNLQLQQTGHYGQQLIFLDSWFGKTEESTSKTATYEHQNTRRSNEQFRLEPLQPRFKRVMPGETATKRTLLFSVSTCITNGGSTGATQKLMGLPFDVYRIIYDSNGQREKIVKLNDVFNNREPYRTQSATPCLSWLDTLEHQYYIKEHYFKHVYDVRFSGSPPPTLEEDDNEFKSRRTALINPWDWGFTFGQDVESFGGVYAYNDQESKVEENQASQLILFNFRYETISFRYEIDRFMNMKVKKNVLFRIEPLVTRYNSIVKGRGEKESLRDGFYLLKTALQKYYDDHGEVKQFLDTHQKVVLVQGGVIVTPTYFSVADLRLMRVRSNLLVELEPLDERKLCEYSFEQKNKEFLKMAGPEGEYAQKKIEACRVINLSVPMTFPDGGKDPHAFDSYLLPSTGPEGTGLRARTFVGPIIPLSNSFSSSMWATDMLDESDCLEREICDKIHKAESEWKNVKDLPPGPEDFVNLHRKHRYSQFQKYFESESNRPLKNVSVTQLMEEQVKLDRMTEEDMDFFSSFHYYAENSNLEYLQLDEKSLRNRFSDQTIARVNKALPHRNMIDGFLGGLNQFIIQDNNYFLRRDFFIATSNEELRDEVMREMRRTRSVHPKLYDSNDRGIRAANRSDLDQLLVNGKIEPELGLRMCAYWFHDFLPKRVGMTTAEFYKSKDALSAIYDQCKQYQYKRGQDGSVTGLSGIFAVDQRLKIQELKDYSFERGMSFNVHVNADKRITHSEDFKRSIQLNLRVPEIPSGIIPGSANFYDVLQKWFGFIGGNLGVNRGQTNASQFGMSSSAATNLVVQMAKFNVTISEYEPCITIGVRPEFLMGPANFFGATTNRLTVDQKINLSTRGILFCTGESVQTPAMLRENYYYISQNFVEGDMNDPGTLKTHPWLLTLRGSADFSKFMRVLVDTVDLKHATKEILRRDEADRVQENRRLEMTRAHHKSEPGGIIFQGPSDTENDARSFNPGIPVEQRNVGRQMQAFSDSLADGVPRDPEQRANRDRALVQADRWRKEIEERDKQALEGRLDIRTLGRSREVGPLNPSEVAKVMGSNNPNSAAWLEMVKRQEHKTRFSILDFSHIQIPTNPIRWYFEDPHLDISDEIWDHSIKKLSEIYLGTSSTAPGFIVITPESFETYKEH